MNSRLLDKKNSENRSKLIKKLLAKKNISSSSALIPRRAPDAIVPLSFSQERLWVLDKMGMADAGYNMSYAFELSTSLHIPSLKTALSQLIERHEILRTVFSSDDENPRQVILPSLAFDLPVFEFDTRESLEEAMQNSVRTNFDLEKGPLLRAAIFRRTDIDSGYIVQIALHHIIFDGWSGEVMQRELLALYSNQTQISDAIALDPLPIQYADYSLWQRNKDMQREKAYWRDTLSDYDGRLQIPQDFFPASGNSQEVGFCSRGYSREFTQALTQFNQQHGCTIFMSTLAAFALVACRYTHRQDVCLGVTVSGREAPELESLLGFFVNILPIRVDLGLDLSVAEYMSSVRRAVLNAFDHQSLPYEQLLKALKIKRDDSLSGLVPLMIRHTNFIQKKQGSEELAHRENLFKDDNTGDHQRDQQDILPAPSNAQQSAKCDIDMVFSGGTEPGERLSLLIEYASDKFSKARMERLIDHHQHVLETMFFQPEKKISDISLFSDEEHHELLVERNKTEAKVDTHQCLPQLFEEMVKETPNAVACYCGEEKITFEQLNQRANKLAYYLRAKGVEPEKLVGVCMPRSIDLLVSLLAIFKAGGAYVPIDPNYPVDYVDTILDDAGVDILLAKYECSSLLKKSTAECIYLDKIGDSIAKEFSQNLLPCLNASHLANVLYTSGSTGKPKGVMVPHSQILNCFDNVWKLMPFSEGDVVAQKTTASFAVSVKELFAGLLKGYPVAIFSDEEVKDTRLFVKQLRAWHITRLNIVPSQLQLLVETHSEELAELKHLRFVVTAGEPLTTTLLDQFTRLCPHVRLFNNYGCTELNDTTYFEASSGGVSNEAHGADRFVSIGYPIQNTKLYILDSNRHPVPVGVSGELYVASLGLPRGYLHQPEMTAERFIENPFSDDREDYLFNTGDVVRYLDDGRLEYLSRWDFQVKIRGFRIDLRQIEYLLRQHPDIANPVVHPCKASASENDVLAAYYQVKSKSLTAGTLKQYLATKLPDYMVPSFFVELDTLPFLPNGKLDRRALPAPNIEGGNASGSGDPSVDSTISSRSEVLLASIWSDVLNLVGVNLNKNSNFFDLGGSSLSAMKAIKGIEKFFCISLRLNQFFMSQSLGELSSVVREQQKIALVFLSKSEGDLLGSYSDNESDILDDRFSTLLKRMPKENFNVYVAEIARLYQISIVLHDSKRPGELADNAEFLNGKVRRAGLDSDLVPLLNSQVFYLDIKKNPSYEMIAGLLKLEKDIVFSALKASVVSLVKEFESLSVYFKKVGGEWFQYSSKDYGRIEKDGVVQEKCIDDSCDEFYALCDAIAIEENKKLNIENPFLFRIIYFENTSRNKFCVAMSFNHLIYDGFSDRLVMSRLFELYALHSKGVSGIESSCSSSVYAYHNLIEQKMGDAIVREKLSHWLDSKQWLDKGSYMDNPYVIPERSPGDYEIGNLVKSNFIIPASVWEPCIQYFQDTYNLWVDDALMLLILREISGNDSRGFIPFWSMENGRTAVDDEVVNNLVGYLAVGLIVGLHKEEDWRLDDWVDSLKKSLYESRANVHEFSSAYYNHTPYAGISDADREKIKSIPYPNIYFNFKGVFEGGGQEGDFFQELSESNDVENEFYSGIHFYYFLKDGEIVLRIMYSRKLYSEKDIEGLYAGIFSSIQSFS